MPGMQTNSLVKLIIAMMVFAIILTPLTLYSGESGKNSALVKKCKLEVTKASKISLLSDSMKKKLENQDYADCPRIELGELDLSKDEEKAKQQLSRILVDEYYDCWDKFGQGQLNPYKGDIWFQDKRCYVCSTFTSPDNYDEMDVEFERYKDVFPDKFNFFASGLLYDGKETYYKISKLDPKDDVFEFKDITKEPLEFVKGSKYHLLNVLVVDQEGRGPLNIGAWFGYNTYETKSKMVIVRDTNLPEVCYFVEN
ncbi:hypothetical protein KY321_03090 [Candidatus Woesearchaeota archaeon]|nr:hypothetical protein [Candidatus Woesearchaeota archaeon]